MVFADQIVQLLRRTITIKEIIRRNLRSRLFAWFFLHSQMILVDEVFCMNVGRDREFYSFCGGFRSIGEF